jgi:hypothetical protein
MHTIQLSNQLHNVVKMLKISNETEFKSTAVSKVEFQAIKQVFVHSTKKESKNEPLFAWD